jgi:hypothetical protein
MRPQVRGLIRKSVIFFENLDDDWGVGGGSQQGSSHPKATASVYIVRGINRPSEFLLVFAIKADRSTGLDGAHEPEAPVDLVRFALCHRTADSLAASPAASDASAPIGGANRFPSGSRRQRCG